MTPKCAKYHGEGEIDCIECNHVDVGGNRKRFICKLIGHKIDYVYSWIGNCERCRCERYIGYAYHQFFVVEENQNG